MTTIAKNILGQKILVISDTHLTKRFYARKYNFLKNLINDSDKVIIVGDFWDGWLTDFDGFINSKWKQLFPSLLEKNAVYVFGNHDSKNKNDNRAELFSAHSAESYDLLINNELYHFEHGRKILEIDEDYFSNTYTKIIKTADKYNLKIILILLTLMKHIGFIVFGEKLMCNSKFALKRNAKQKNASRDGWIICGDTHCPELDHRKKYANSGCIIQGYASYIIIDNGKITLHDTKY